MFYNPSLGIYDENNAPILYHEYAPFIPNLTDPFMDYLDKIECRQKSIKRNRIARCYTHEAKVSKWHISATGIITFIKQYNYNEEFDWKQLHPKLMKKQQKLYMD